MDAPIPEKLRVLETRNGPEDPLLRPGFQSRLETDEVPHLRGAIFLPQLHHGVWLTPGASPGINQSNWFHRSEPQGLRSPLRHFFDREAAFEIRHFVPLVPRHVLLARQERRDERLVLALSERRVPVVVSPALAVARGFEQAGVVERIGGHDWRDRVEERQRRRAQPRGDCRGECVRCQGAGGDDARAGKIRHFTTNDRDIPVSRDPSPEPLREHDAIDGERAAAGNPRRVRRREHDAADLPHLVQRYTYSPLGEGPGGFTARETTANNDGVQGRSMLRPYVVTSSASGADSSTTIVCPHLRHLRVVSPVVLDLISSMPTNPQLGHGTRTGLFQVE